MSGTEDVYRVPTSYAEPGTRMGQDGWYVVKSPEEELIERVIQTVRALDGVSPRTHKAQQLRGQLDAYTYALVQAGSSWFFGDEPRKLERAYTRRALESSGSQGGGARRQRGEG